MTVTIIKVWKVWGRSVGREGGRWGRGWVVNLRRCEQERGR